jgi:hypothetical protein
MKKRKRAGMRRKKIKKESRKKSRSGQNVTGSIQNSIFIRKYLYR